MSGTGTPGERWVVLFLLGALAFSPPLLSIFSVDAMIFGIPVLYVYLFAAWGALIALAVIVAKRHHRPERAARRDPKSAGDIPPDGSTAD